MKEGLKFNKYLDLAKEQKKMRNMAVIEIAIIVEVIGTIYKNLENKLGKLYIRG